MHLGYYESKVNKKNQLTLPSKFIKQTGREITVTSWFENSLVVIPRKIRDEFFSQNLGQNSILLPEARDLQRFFYANAVELTLDKKGRFVLPKRILEFAHIGDNAIFLGVGHHIELWDKAYYENYGHIKEAQIRQTAIDHYTRITKKI